MTREREDPLPSIGGSLAATAIVDLALIVAVVVLAAWLFG